jgi:hypothetical protein
MGLKLILFFYLRPPLVNYLIENYGWQITMIILGGITLQACVLGALLRPEEGLVRRAKIQKYLIKILTLGNFLIYLLNI